MTKERYILKHLLGFWFLYISMLITLCLVVYAEIQLFRISSFTGLLWLLLALDFYIFVIFTKEIGKWLEAHPLKKKIPFFASFILLIMLFPTPSTLKPIISTNNQFCEPLASSFSQSSPAPSFTINEEPVWQLGESITIQYDFQETIFSNWELIPRHTSIWNLQSGETYQYGSLVNIRANDGAYSIFGVRDDTTDEVQEWAFATLIIEFPVTTTGTLYFDMFVRIYEDDADYQDKCSINSNIKINTSNIGNDQMVRISLLFGAYELASKHAFIESYFISGSASAQLTYQDNVHTCTDIQAVELVIDHMEILRDTITEQKRNEYQIIDNTKILSRLKIENFEYGSTITIFNPSYLEFASISHTATISEGSNIVISDTIPVTYEILLKGNRSDYFLVIDDYSNSYFQNLGFENGWSEDWTRHTTLPVTSPSLNSSIVFEGAHSLRIAENDAGNHHIGFGSKSKLQEGYYYVTFSYYIESMTITDYDIRFYSGSWHTIFTMDQTTQRWNQAFFFWHLDDLTINNGVYMILRHNGFTGVVFYDNFRVYKVNHKTEITDNQELTIQGTLRNWDGRKDPALPNKPININILDRNDQTLLIASHTSTNSQGTFEFKFNTSQIPELQDRREIEIESWCIQNWFGNPEEILQLQDNPNAFTLSCEAGGTESISLDYTYVTQGNSSTKISFGFEESNDRVNVYHPKDDATFYDITNIDKAYIDLKFSSTSVLRITNSWKQRFGLWDGSGNYKYRYLSASECSTSWFDITFDIENDFDVSQGTFDYTTFDAGILGLENITNCDSFTIYLDNFHFLKTQSSSFQTLQPNEFQFFHEQTPSFPISKEWDYSEDYESNSGHYSSSVSFENGMCLIHPYTSTVLKFYLQFEDEWEMEASMYYILQIRVKTNVSDIHFKIYDTSDNTVYTWLEFSNMSWHYWEIDLSLDSDWTGTESGFYFYIDEIGDDGQPEEDNFLFFDLVRLIHRQPNPVIHLTSNFAFLSSQNNTFVYEISIDGVSLGYYLDFDPFQLNTTEFRTYTITVTCFLDYSRELAFLPISFTTNYRVIEADWEFTDLYFDISDFYVSFGFSTTWENLTALIYENGTFIGTASEYEIFSFPRNLQANKKFNITIVVGGEILEYWYKNAPAIETSYRVWFDFVDGVGLGLDFETFKLYINGSRQYSQELTVPNGTLLMVTAQDFFNVTLATRNYTITQDTDIMLVIDVYEVIFRNNNTKFDSEVLINRNGIELNLTVPKDTSVIHRFSLGVYEITSYMIVPNDLYSLISENFTEGKHIVLSRPITFSKELEILASSGSKIIDVGGPEPKISELESLRKQIMNMGFILLILASTIVGLVFRELWYVTKAGIFRKGTEDSIITPNELEAKQDRYDAEQRRENLQRTQNFRRK